MRIIGDVFVEVIVFFISSTFLFVDLVIHFVSPCFPIGPVGPRGPESPGWPGGPLSKI